MKSLTVHEHQAIPIGPVWSSRPPRVTPADVNELHQIQTRLGVDAFALGHRSIRASSWVGSLAVGRRLYEILPKVDVQDDAPVRENLHLMLAVGGLLPIREIDLAPLVGAHNPLLITYLEIFVRRLAAEWRRGPLRRYQVHELNSPFLRGRLLIQRQLVENVLHQERFCCSRDEFTQDNPASRLLRSALDLCYRQQLSGEVSRAARALLPELDGVSSLSPSDLAHRETPLERQHLRYRPLLAMARLICDMESPASSAGGEPVFALLFDMNKVFESFLAAELKSALPYGLRVIPQLRGRSLVQRRTTSGWQGAFGLQPDVGVFRGASPICLLDAKWKALDPAKAHSGVSSADMYQMYAYTREYASCRTVLVYPRTAATKATLADYRLEAHADGVERQILVRSIDVGGRLTLPAVRNLLRDELRSLVGCAPPSFPHGVHPT